MKRKTENNFVSLDSETLSKLVDAKIIKLEFFNATGGLKNGCLLKKVQFSEYDEDKNDGKANIMGVLVNNSRNESSYLVFLSEIKRILSPEGSLIWKNPNL
jgi:hypothetical protein